MPLKLLPHKSWHVYNQENVARVKRDEARAAQEQEQNDERAFQAEAEARLDRLRNKSSRKRRRDGDNEGEKELERQLKGKGKGRGGEEGGADGEEGEHAKAIIVRPEGWTAGKDSRTAKEAKSDSAMTTNGHVNFWAELEAGTQAPASTLEKRLNKVLAEEPDDSLTKVYLAKRGEGEPKGWYASADGKTERERKEPVETTLERTYRDNESKKLDDPLALMNSYLRHRDDIKSGKPLPTPRAPSTRDRYLEPTLRHRPPPPQRERDAWDDTPRSSVSSRASTSKGSGSTAAQRSGFEPVLPRLLPPKHRRPPVSALASTDLSAASSSSAQRPLSAAPPHPEDPQREATHRVQSERARAAALLASRRRASAASSSSYAGSVASSPARSEGIGGWGMYNREEVLAARRGGGSAAAGGGGGGGWGERKERRQEREKFGTAGRGSYSRR
ncbi:hypothetical protein JCM10908_001798 [Rhodotorula pacifica]|uniref:CIR N-terminal domain-containing protein n=1 Tax=Rhodotorula pacifica TaxID=1495444 RepID=UPI003170544F